jgi:antirestriction protein ArdC
MGAALGHEPHCHGASPQCGNRPLLFSILILLDRLFERGYGAQRWIAYRQAQALGGNVRKGEVGTSVCYADRFTPKDEQEKAARAKKLGDFQRNLLIHHG